MSRLVLCVLLSFAAGSAWAQDSPAELTARWTASNTTCRNPAASATDALGACEQRDTLAKLLALAGSGRKPPPPVTASFQRVGGVFVLPALLNGSAQVYFIVDSGAATVQIPQETADELRRNGSLTDADFMGQHRFILADGSTMQQRVFRLRALQIGERTMENVLATVGAPRSRALLGQSFLRRLNWWKIDNVGNAMQYEYIGAQ